MKLSGTIGVTQKTMTLDTDVRLILLQTLNPQERWGTHKKRWPFQPRLFADVIGLVRCSHGTQALPVWLSAFLSERRSMLALSSQCPSLSFSLPSSFCTLVHRVPMSRFVRWLQSSDDVGRKLVVKVDTVIRGIGILSPAKKLKWCPCLMPKRCHLDSAVSFVYTIIVKSISI